VGSAKCTEFAALVLLLAAGCSPTEVSPPETCERFGDAAGRCAVGAIEGHALLEASPTHTGVRVAIVGTDRSTVTAEDGAFSLEKVPPGVYLLSLEADGYVAATTRATVRSGSATELETMTLVRSTIASVVRGRVLLGGRTDHAGTTMSLDGTGIAVFTDADGSFSFSHVRFGAARITARHVGFDPRTVDVEVDRFVVEVGDATLEPLPAPGSVVGLVTAAGAPVEDATVALAGTDFESRTDADGAFEIESVEAGAYDLVVAAPGFLTVLVRVEVGAGLVATLATIDLEPTADAGDLVGFAKRAGESFHGDIEVRLVHGDSVLASTVTDGDGAYRIAPAQVGVHALVFRAAGFPELRIPGVALGPGEWAAPEARLHRSVRIDARRGDGWTAPSGRKALVSYFAGRAGTYLWDGDALSQRQVLSVRAEPIAVDRSESFATLIVEGEDASPALVRLDLANGETAVVTPRPARLIGGYGASTFYFDAEGALHRLLAWGAVATKIEVPVASASIDFAEDGLVLLRLRTDDGEPDTEMPFDPHGVWNGPNLFNRFGPGPDHYVCWTTDGRLLWLDVAGHATVEIAMADRFAVVEVRGRVLLEEHFAPGTGAFDLRSLRFDTGAVEDVVQGAYRIFAFGDASLIIEMADGSLRWMADDGSSVTTTELCAGGSLLYDGRALACIEGATGAFRVATDRGVWTLPPPAADGTFVGGLAISWREPGEVDRIHVADVEAPPGVEVPCVGPERFLGSVGKKHAVACDDGLRSVDLGSGTITPISTSTPAECSWSPDGDRLVCLDDAPCNGDTRCLLAFDLSAGTFTARGVGAEWDAAIGGGMVWDRGGHAAATASGSTALQVAFPASGTPTISRCDLPETGWIRAVERGGGLIWATASRSYRCDPTGDPTWIGASFDRVPLFWDWEAIRLVNDDGTLELVAEATSVDSGPLGDELAWFVAWKADGSGAAFVVSLETGRVECIGENLDRSRLHWPRNGALYFEGEVDGAAGLYRWKPGSGTVRLLDRGEIAGSSGDHVFFHDGTSTWIEHGDAALLVNDFPVDESSLFAPWDRGFVYTPGTPDERGTWWFALP